MIIDGHAHLGGAYQDLKSILASLEKAGADKVVLCPSDSPRENPMWIPHLLGRYGGKDLNFLVNRMIRRSASGEEAQDYIFRGNEDVFKIAAASGGRVIQFYWADPLKKSLPEDLEKALSKWKFKGIKLHQCAQPFKIKSSRFHWLAEFAASNQLPVFIHFHSKNEIRDFIAVAGNYKTNFIVGHIIGLELFLKFKEELSDNVYFDISCPPLVSTKRTKLALKEFGASRIIMGSDAPFGKDNLVDVISRIKSIDMKPDEKEMILGGNMAALLNK